MSILGYTTVIDRDYCRLYKALGVAREGNKDLSPQSPME
jgi:hypothetical protein